MSKKACIIFPHQLFESNKLVKTSDLTLIVEDQLFFGDFYYPARFHKYKLVFHRASMQAYKDKLVDDGFNVHYISYAKSPEMAYLFEALKDNRVGEVHLFDPVDFMLEKRLRKFADKNEIKINFHETPGFITEKSFYRDYFDKNKYYNASFYAEQRKRHEILVDDEQKPVGGKWSFDPDNRKKLPKKIEIPFPNFPKPNKYVKDAIEYVETNFPDNPGSTDHFNYPVTRSDALAFLDDFFENRFKRFGDYEDSISENHPYVFHSVLSPLINSGLLTPEETVDRALDYADENKIPLNSLEGFVRQIIGWREFMRAVYDLEGIQQRNSNFWDYERRMPGSFYTGETGIEPVDHVIKKLIKTGYCHHIERLMVLGNFMLLCEIHPCEVYRWFMEMFIDSYDWVMVPNIYGMSQYADGGLITTKPYISSSNYIRKMSDYKKGEWCDVWDGLYWRFLHKNLDKIKDNYRMKMMVSMLKRMDDEKLRKHLHDADKYLSHLNQR